MAYNVERISEPMFLGEGPHWDVDQQALYFVDAWVSTIGRYLPSEDRVTLCKVDESACVAFIIPIKGKPGKFLVPIGAKLTEVTWDGESSTPEDIKVLKVMDEVKEKPHNRFNDGKVDPTGRLWAGTFGRYFEGKWDIGAGSLYSFGDDLESTMHESGTTISNGLAWSSDLKNMYYIDTPTQKISGYDFDAENGTISNKRTVFDFTEYNLAALQGGPDGMTIDTDDNLWVAGFGAAGVFNINPRTSELIRKIDIPSLQVTSVAFGGPELDELFVVSANVDLPEEIRKQYPDEGCTFKVTGLGVKGLPMLSYETP